MENLSTCPTCGFLLSPLWNNFYTLLQAELTLCEACNALEVTNSCCHELLGAFIHVYELTLLMQSLEYDDYY